MSAVVEEEIKRWTARRKSQLVLEIIQGRTSVSEASRQFDLPPSEIESWVDDCRCVLTKNGRIAFRVASDDRLMKINNQRIENRVPIFGRLAGFVKGTCSCSKI